RREHARRRGGRLGGGSVRLFAAARRAPAASLSLAHAVPQRLPAPGRSGERQAPVGMRIMGPVSSGVRTRERHSVSFVLWVCVGLGTAACKEDPPEDTDTELAAGEACDPNAETADAGGDAEGGDGAAVCAPGLSCEPVDGSEDYVCGAALEIRGLVSDAADGAPVEGALVAALNEAGEPVTDVVTTDSCGAYVLPVSVRRQADGSFAETPKWTLSVSAQDYLPFPVGLRPALPVDIADAMADPDPPETDDGADSDGETYVSDVIDNAATRVALLGLPDDERGGAVVSGTVEGEGVAGMLVVAEGTGGRAPYGIVDASGHYTLFNVPDGMVTLRGYRRGVEV